MSSIESVSYTHLDVYKRQPIVYKRTALWCYLIETIKRLRTFLCILKEESMVDKVCLLYTSIGF